MYNSENIPPSFFWNELRSVPSKYVMLPEKPLTPTVADTSADPGVSEQGKQDSS